MIRVNPAVENEKTGRKLKPFEKKLIAAIIAIAIIVAGFGIYYEGKVGDHSQNSIVIYTYDSFMAYGPNYTKAYNTIFGTFEREYGVTITVKNVSSAQLITTLESQKSNHQSDIVIGLTEANGIQAYKDGLLVKYSPPGDNSINSSLLAEMGSASSYLTPYEYSYLGIDYNVTNPSGPEFNPTFQDLSSSQNASNLIIENPTTDATGQEFLLWEIAYYQYLLHENWTVWWNTSMPIINTHSDILPSWGTAFNQFESSKSNQSLLVSYLSDPAYNNYFGYGNYTNSTVTAYNGIEYGWRTIYNLGIVNGSGNLNIDEKFVNYFLGKTVQDEIPTNEWMYPANSTISLPPSYSVAMNQSVIVPLNDYLNASTIYTNLQNWLLQWETYYG